MNRSARTDPVVALVGPGDALADQLHAICRGIPIQTIELDAYHGSTPWELIHRVSFAVTAWDGSEPAEGPDQTFLGLPHAVLASTKPNPSQLETLRQAGGSVVLEGEAGDARTLIELLQSPQWFVNRVGKVPLADTLQLLAASNHTGVLSVSCPHAHPFTPRAWHAILPSCTGNSSCSGASARLFFDEGRLVHAETPNSTGMPALATALSYRDGIARLLEVFLAPAEKSLAGSVGELLLQAAFYTDERKLGPPAPAAPQSPLPELRPASSDAMTSPPENPLETLCPEARIVVDADKNGHLRRSGGRGGDQDESVAAVAAMLHQAFDSATHALGLGVIQGWTVVSEDSCCVAATHPEGIAAAATEPSKDSFRLLDRFVSNTSATLGAPSSE